MYSTSTYIGSSRIDTCASHFLRRVVSAQESGSAILPRAEFARDSERNTAPRQMPRCRPFFSYPLVTDAAPICTSHPENQLCMNIQEVSMVHLTVD